MKNGFALSRDVDISVINSDYYLHTHGNQHEILLFLDGACEFHVEGSVYKLSPYDMVIAPANELHGIVHTASHRYERYLCDIDTDFFIKNNCTQYAGVFENKLPGIGNYFSAEFVKSSGIVDVMERICKYSAEGEDLVAKGAFFELLYQMKKMRSGEQCDTYNSGYVRNAITYINENLTADLSMDAFSEQFHINGEYLGKLFKKQMKISMKEYITYKRLLYASELYKSGKNLLESSLEAGFSNYSIFYRMYVKEFGQSPSNGMKHK